MKDKRKMLTQCYTTALGCRVLTKFRHGSEGQVIEDITLEVVSPQSFDLAPRADRQKLWPSGGEK